jgi:hypothetical protein
MLCERDMGADSPHSPQDYKQSDYKHADYRHANESAVLAIREQANRINMLQAQEVRLISLDCERMRFDLPAFRLHVRKSHPPPRPIWCRKARVRVRVRVRARARVRVRVRVRVMVAPLKAALPCSISYT